MRFFVIATLSALAMALLSPAIHAADGPSVRDIVEFTNVVLPHAHDAEGMRRQTSPDGTRAFIVTRRANVAADVNHYEIVVLDLTAQRLAERRPAKPEVVYAFDAGMDNNSADPALVQVEWSDDRTLIFRAKIKDDIFQVYQLDLPTRAVVQLTSSATPVVSFAVSRDSKRLVYAAQVANPPMKAGAHSIVVGNQSFWSVMFGQQYLGSQTRMYRFYVQDVGAGQRSRPLGDAFFEGNSAIPVVSISPDGQWAALPKYERERTLAWSRQYPGLAERVRQSGPAVHRDPLGYFSGATSFTARRMTVWRLDDGHEQTIVDAPDDSEMAGGQFRLDRVWQRSGKSLVLAGTYLPADEYKSSAAAHVIEYWPATGAWKIVARLNGRLQSAVGVEGLVEIDDGGKRRQFRRTETDAWVEVAPVELASKSPWRMDVKEGLNEPPDVFAVGPQNQAVRLTTLNPQFDPKSWGTVANYTWQDAKGRSWRGGLLAPTDVVPGKRLPLVIQSYGYYPENFFLDGPNSSVRGGKSAFPGRAFIREGVLTLVMSMSPVGHVGRDAADQLRLFNEGVRGAVDTLVKTGKVDPARVGIMGWSTTGEKVLNLVTFSDLPVRAATIADGDANTLFSYTLTYGRSDSTWAHKENLNHGLLNSANQANWVGADPSLNTACIKTALRIETYGRLVKNNWDIYALLRRQFKPVEMVVFPGGTHVLSTPSERMTSLQGNVDWFKFWLKDERRSAPLLSSETPASLKAQYDAWQQMAALKRADDSRPRCTLKTLG